MILPSIASSTSVCKTQQACSADSHDDDITHDTNDSNDTSQTSQTTDDNRSTTVIAPNSISQQVQREMMQWIIETRACGGKSFNIWLYPTDTIGELKQLIEKEHLNLPPSSQVLCFNNRLLSDDSAMICQLQIPTGSRISLTVNMQSGLLNTQRSPQNCSIDTVQAIYQPETAPDDLFVLSIKLYLLASQHIDSQFLGLINGPLTANSLASQLSSLLDTLISVSQILDVTWSKIVLIDDEEEEDLNNNDSTSTPWQRLAQLATGNGTLHCCDGNSTYLSVDPCNDTTINSPIALATETEQCNSSNIGQTKHDETKEQMRCGQCHRKISLANAVFKCKCLRSFCNLHRYSDRHSCTAELRPGSSVRMLPHKRQGGFQLAKL